MTTDTTGAALLAIIRANPAGWDARRVYADWLDDGSEEGAILAAGQRWQAANEKRTNHAMSWGATGLGLSEWSCDWWRVKNSRGFDCLPPELWDLMDGHGYSSAVVKEYPTPDAAEAALARALWALGIQAT